MTRMTHLVFFVAAILLGYTLALQCDVLHESWNICGEACLPNCAVTHVNPARCPRIPCSNDTTAGCRCDDGYLRDTQTGNCVLPGDCPSNSSSTVPR